jgi:adenine phosphoribosyltransferase
MVTYLLSDSGRVGIAKCIQDNVELDWSRDLRDFTTITLEDCDLILAPEAMGIPLAVPLSLRTGIPYNVVRKRRYGLPGEVSLQQTTGYSRTDMFINGISEGDRVVIVDDVISTGGTIAAIVKALQGMGALIVDIIVVVEKGDRRPILERELGVVIKTLVKVEVRQGRTRVLT